MRPLADLVTAKLRAEDVLRCERCFYAMGMSPVALAFRRWVRRIPGRRNGYDYRRCPRCQYLHEYEVVKLA